MTKYLVEVEEVVTTVFEVSADSLEEAEIAYVDFGNVVYEDVSVNYILAEESE